MKVKIEKHTWDAEKGHLVTVSLSNKDWAKLMPTFDAAKGFLEISVSGVKNDSDDV